jgi:hypothetical protein
LRTPERAVAGRAADPTMSAREPDLLDVAVARVTPLNPLIAR